jgi:uncharacterized membrane protein YphA (DoxX/SURF4 family)
MKIIVNVIRVFVGLLFIFSGLVKANDPLGTAYKMEEYFEVWNRDLESGSFFLKNVLMNLFHFFNEHTLFLSVTMNAFEIIAGAALLLGWRMRLFSWLLLVLMIFFTILTGYTYKTGQPTNCGCFGDCIKITPQFSFYKDVLLSVLILVLLFTRKHIQPLFKPGMNTALMFLITLFSFGLQWYSLRYLPPVDCLPFKRGNNIPEKMKVPANAVPDVFETRLVYRNINTKEKKDMSQDEFNNSKIWEDSTWVWDTTLTKLVKKGKNNQPAINGFSLIGPTITDTVTGQETKEVTTAILSLPQVLLFFNTDLPGKAPSWKNDLLEVYNEAAKKGIPFYFISPDRDSVISRYSRFGFANVNGLGLDLTVIRTAARSNQTLYLLKQGNIAGKWSFAELDDAKNQIGK